LTHKADAARTAKGTLGFVVQSSANSLLGLLLFATLARFITKSEMGVYAALSFSIALFQVVGILGLNTAGTRFIAKLLAERERSAASAVARKIILISLGSGGVLALAHYALAPQFSFLMSQTPDFAWYFAAASMVILVHVPMLAFEGLMQGVQEYGRLATLRMLAQLVRILVSVWLLLNGWGLIGMVVGWTILGLVMVFCAVPFLGFHLDLRVGSYALAPVFKYSLPMLGASLVAFFSNSVDIFVVMTQGSPADLGVYNVAVTASGALTTILIASATATLLPAMSACFGSGGAAAVERVFHRSTRYLSLLYIPAALGLASLAWPVIWVMGGTPYRDSILPLATISISFLAYSLSTPLTITLQAIGETKRVLFVVLEATVVGSLTTVVLFPIFGIEGAALGRASLFATTLVMSFYESRKAFKPRFDLNVLWKSVVASLLMALVVYFVGSLGATAISIPVGVFLGAVIYLTMLRFLKAVKPEDIRVLNEVLLSRLGRLSGPMERVITRLLIQTGS